MNENADDEMIQNEQTENHIEDHSFYFIDGYLKEIIKEMNLRQIIPNAIKYIILNFSANTLLIGYGKPDYFKIDSIKIDNIVKCASFHAHSLFLDVKGNVYGIGDNEECQLGLDIDDANVPQLISIQANIIEVAVGGSHSILLCDKGCIYTMGWNKYNQCAQGNEKYIKSPKKCEFFGSKGIVKISAGAFHSGCIASDNSVYLFGLNKYGQCGVEKWTGQTQVPQKMDVCAKSVSCGFAHTLIISANNKLYACGWNEDGQIGNDTKNTQFGLMQVNLPPNVIDADCGYAHNLCTLENGAAYSWGRRVSGQLGHGDDNDNKFVPTQIKIKNIKFKKCVAGLHNSCLIDESDNFYCFGDNEHGQLCVGDKKNKFIPTKIEKKNVLDVSMGCDYSFLMFGEKQRKKKEDNVSKENENQNFKN